MKKDEKCPHCGYCPHCGRSAAPVKTVPYPMPYPVPYPQPVPIRPWPYQPSGPTWISQPTITCSDNTAINSVQARGAML